MPARAAVSERGAEPDQQSAGSKRPQRDRRCRQPRAHRERRHDTGRDESENEERIERTVRVASEDDGAHHPADTGVASVR